MIPAACRGFYKEYFSLTITRMKMHRNFIRKSGGWLAAGLLLSILILAVQPGIVNGQNENTISLSTPDTSQFPQISAFFWPVNADGELIQDLQPDELTVLENDRSVGVGSLEKIEPGIHFVFAVNEGPTLANRYAGAERFASIKDDLSKWIESVSPPTATDFSIVNNEGTVQSNLTNPSDWLNALQNYQPDLRAATPAMTSLSSAIDLAADVGDKLTKTKVVLYVTPLPDDVQLSGIQDAAKRAEEMGVRLFVWLIGPQNYSATDAALVLQKAASDTGGSFFLFSGAETLPDVSAYLNPLKYVYRLTYTTSIRSAGNFDLALKVDRGGTTIQSPSVPFSLDVQPPSPIFLSPPIQLTRTWVNDDETGDLTLSPVNTELRIMIEFPDGHIRPLAASRLFIDGELVSENTSAPFDVFGWDLSGYSASETHLLKVTLEDQLGLTNQTIEIPVQVVVNAKPQSRLQKLIAWFNPLRGVLVGLGLIFIGVLAWNLLRRSRILSRIKTRVSRKSNDVVTQPVAMEQIASPARPARIEPSDWPRMPGGGASPARLRVCSADDLQPLPGEGIPLSKPETSLGSNAKKVDVLLSGESVSEVHALIIKEAEGQYRLEDAGSTTGTWVNYSPVPVRPVNLSSVGIETGGTLLEHGDLIHIGRIPLRFEIYRSTPRRIQVIPLEDPR